MNNIVAVAVEQAQIDVTVIAMITVDVMNLDHIRCRERKVALFTFAALLLQEFDHPHRFERVAHQPLRPVDPIAIEGAFGANHFGVSFDSALVVVMEVVGLTAIQ